jgi:hypothetical protein
MGLDGNSRTNRRKDFVGVQFIEPVRRGLMNQTPTNGDSPWGQGGNTIFFNDLFRT